MRAQLIELTPESRAWSRKAWWLNMPFTIAWQSSKVPVDRQRMDVVVLDRRHHAPLHVGDAPLREQHEDVGAGAAAERLDRGAAGIAGGGDHDGGAFAARLERVVHEPAQELHRQVLEGERRTMEQLEHEIAHSELHQRRDRGMAEIAVGLARHAGEVGSAMASPTNGRITSTATSA